MNQNEKNEKNEKAKETLSNIWQKTTDVSKKAAKGIQQGAKTLSEQAKEAKQNQQVKKQSKQIEKQNKQIEKQIEKYQPITSKVFKSRDFNIPNVIEIVDDAVRRDIPVCKDAIGWLETHKGVEVLHLYDEYVQKSGLQFVPVGICDNVYYVDAFDRKKFINVNTVFSKTNEEKLAELERIAFCLGATSCSIEIVEGESEESTATATGNVSSPIKINANAQSKNKSKKNQSGKATSYFTGHNSPKKPTLKWFAHDDSIKALIEMRCTRKNSIKSRTLELKGSSCATMSVKVGVAIDAVLGGGGKGKAKNGGGMSMESQAIREHNNHLLFKVEF